MRVAERSGRHQESGELEGKEVTEGNLGFPLFVNRAAAWFQYAERSEVPRP